MNFFKSFVIISGIFFIIGCDSSSGPSDTNMPTNGKAVQLINPKGGETFTFNQKITISFKVDGSKITGATPQISINSGKEWKNIKSTQITPTSPGGNLLTYDWVIGSESDSVAYQDINNECKCRIQGYGKSDFDDSSIFTINK